MRASLPRGSFDFFLFSSLYIAGCAVLMTHQSNHLLRLQYAGFPYFLFVFFSTICSYNFHWWLTPASATELLRITWSQQYRRVHLFLFIVGLAGSGMTAIYFLEHWFWLCGAIFLTFLYSAPKLPVYPFTLLRRIAVGKTLFPAFVWMYVTAFLPIVFAEKAWQAADILFCASRFFLVYSICIVFDYRDRDNDKKEGIRSMITYFDVKGIDRIFYISLCLFGISTLALYFTGFPIAISLLLLMPGIILLALYRKARKRSSDYYYYFYLDGLMMFSAIFTSFISI